MISEFSVLSILMHPNLQYYTIGHIGTNRSQNNECVTEASRAVVAKSLNVKTNHYPHTYNYKIQGYSYAGMSLASICLSLCRPVHLSIIIPIMKTKGLS